MQIIGYVRSDFTAADKTKIEGYNVFFTEQITSPDGKGLRAEKIYLSVSKLSNLGINLPDLIGKEVDIFFSRFGKPLRIEVKNK